MNTRLLWPQHAFLWLWQTFNFSFACISIKIDNSIMTKTMPPIRVSFYIHKKQIVILNCLREHYSKFVSFCWQLFRLCAGKNNKNKLLGLYKNGDIFLCHSDTKCDLWVFIRQGSLSRAFISSKIWLAPDFCFFILIFIRENPRFFRVIRVPFLL